MTPRVDPRRTRLWARLASVLSVAVILGSCGSPSPTASPGGSGSITKSSAPGRSSSPVPAIEADSATKIDAAERAGTIDHDTALMYKLYASLAYGSLPAAYQSSNPAAPEATTILDELSGRLDALPPELRAKVAPFFLRPTDPESFWQTRSATAAVDAGAIALAAFHDVTEYAFVDAKQTSVRVWYAVPGGSSEQGLAQRLADEIDSSTMWAKEKTAMLGHEPCTDANSPNNGGDGRLDVYLVYPLSGLDWGGRKDTLRSDAKGRFISGADIPEPVERPGCPLTSHIIVNATLDFDHLKNAMAHELFHAFQLSFKNAALDDRDWWAEASATWAMDLVYPTLNFEQPYLDGYWSKAGGFEEGPLDSTTGAAAYGAYLWPFYLVQKSGDKGGTVVGQLWQASETQSPIQAISHLPGWSDSFKEFALWNWNKDSVVKYVDAGAQIPAENLSQDTACIDSAGSGNDCPLKVGKTTLQVTQGPTTVQYYEGVPDRPQVEQLRFDLRQFKGKPGGGLQAVISYGKVGQPNAYVRVEDWSNLDERRFCMRLEDVTNIVLVVTNSSIDPASQLQAAIPIEALADPCGGSVFTMTRTESHSSTSNYPCNDVTQTAGSSQVSIVIIQGDDGKATATITEQRNETSVREVTGCQGYSYYSVMESIHASGTRDATVQWHVNPDGKISFDAIFDPIVGSDVRTVVCSPGPCPETTVKDFSSQWDGLQYEATGDPSKSVITGSQIDDQSTANNSDVIIYTWSLGQ